MNKINLFIYLPICLFTFLNYGFSQNITDGGFEEGRIFVRIDDESLRPVLSVDSILYFENSEIQNIIEANNVYQIERPFSEKNNNITSVEKRLFSTYRLRCDCNTDTLITELNEAFDSNVFIEKIPKVYTLATPNDYNWISQFEDDCNNSFQNYYLDNINALEAWEVTEGDPNIKIGIVDTKFNLNHEDFINSDNTTQYDDVNIISSPNDYHGTGVAGLAAAATNNEKGISAIGYNCKMDFYECVNSDFYDGLYAASNNNEVKVISMSWSGPTYNATFHDN